MEITFQIIGKLDPVAIYAAIVATFVAGWNIFTWLHTGPKLTLRIQTGMMMVPPIQGTKESDLYMVCKVANVGTAPTTVTNLVIFGFSNWLSYIRKRPDVAAVVNCGPPTSPQVPYVIKVGETFTALVRQDAELEEWSRKYHLFGGVAHSSSEREICARIQPIKSKTQSR